MTNLVQKIQQKLEAQTDASLELRYSQKGDLYAIEFIADEPASPLCSTFFEIINTEEFAEQILSLRLQGADEGINGTNNWDLAALSQNPKIIFKNLRELILPLNDKNHNKIIVTGNDDYEENGVIAKLLPKMPNLEVLQVPSAPNEDFFKHFSSIKTLYVQAGYKHQNFIYNLAQSKNFENLEIFKFWDYAESYIENYEQHATSVGDYIALFSSTHLPKLRKLHLYHTQLSPQDQEKLHSLPLVLQLDELIIETAK